MLLNHQLTDSALTVAMRPPCLLLLLLLLAAAGDAGYRVRLDQLAVCDLRHDSAAYTGA